MDSKKLRTFNGGVCVYSSDYFGKVKIFHLVIDTRNVHESVTIIDGFNTETFDKIGSMLQYVRGCLFQNGFRVHTTEDFGGQLVDNIFFVDINDPEHPHRFFIN